MTTPASTYHAPVGLPATLDGFVVLIRAHEGDPVTEEQMAAAGVEPTIAHMFFADYGGADRSMPLSNLAPHVAGGHSDYHPAAIRTAHLVLSQRGVVRQPHDPRGCDFCTHYLEEG